MVIKLQTGQEIVLFSILEHFYVIVPTKILLQNICVIETFIQKSDDFNIGIKRQNNRNWNLHLRLKGMKIIYSGFGITAGLYSCELLLILKLIFSQ